MVVVVEGSIKDKEKYFKRGRSNGLVAGGLLQISQTMGAMIYFSIEKCFEKYCRLKI